MLSFPAFRKALLEWFESQQRDLPWRRTSDPYRIWISEIMLQQTRVAAAIPYYERFLNLFPDVRALAAAKPEMVLAAWAGLGYYSRARNLHKAAQQMAGVFPAAYEAIRALPGIGDYTAAAVASIAFRLPHAAVDGNVLRVLSRLTNDASDIAVPKTRQRFQAMADAMLHRDRPGEFNQAMMELGATLCLPKQPQCLLCPVRRFCRAAQAGTQDQLPVKRRPERSALIDRTILIVRSRGRLLMWQRPPDDRKLGGFWELPEIADLPEARIEPPAGSFRHAIMHQNYRFTVCLAEGKPAEGKPFQWVPETALNTLPVSTTARKAMRCWRPGEDSGSGGARRMSKERSRGF